MLDEKKLREMIEQLAAHEAAELWKKENERVQKAALARLIDRTLIWQKGHISPTLDAAGTTYRYDDFGRAMMWAAYGNRDSKLGWEIDHIKPQKDGGSDAISNLRPLNWVSNLERNKRP